MSLPKIPGGVKIPGSVSMPTRTSLRKVYPEDAGGHFFFWHIYNYITRSSLVRRVNAYSRKDVKVQAVISRLVLSTTFNIAIMATIILSSITIAMETTYLEETMPNFFMTIDLFYLAVFFIEFLLKLYAEPIGYWKNGYNLFDFLVLCVSGLQTILSSLNILRNEVVILKVTRVLRAVRIFRSVSFIRGLQVLVTALLATFLNAIVPLLFLLIVMMFIFSIIGYYWFGYNSSGDQENWGTLGRAMLSLFTFVTADNWTDVHYRLTALGFRGSEVFTIIFILLGHFLFINLFIGVIISNIHNATKTFDAARKQKKDAFLQRKKMAISQKHHRDVLRVLERQIAANFKNFQEMTEEFQKTLRHDDFTYSAELCTNKPWIDTFVATLGHLENSRYRVQQCHLDLARILTHIKEEGD